MRPLWKDILAAAWLGILIPGIVLNAAVLFARKQPQEAAAETQPEPSETVVLALETGDITLSMEDYLTGVVLAEMPASFHPEALKAQAVAAGTYARKGAKHDGSLCGNPGCCQAYISPGDYILEGGTPEDAEKVRLAVMTVTPYVLMYEEELIEAVYFSCSGGQTEDAVAVWGSDVPYLQSVPSEGEEAAAVFQSEKTVSCAAFRETVLSVYPDADFSQDPSFWIGDVVYTQGGGVDTVVIGGQTVKGTALRSLFHLNSTNIAIRLEQDQIVFAVKGYGHRVGMSQYGANAMAKTGSTYREILQHYYTGAEIRCIQ